MSKRAIILAGGRGTRLRPYTVVLPKPLMPLGDYPILEIIIRQLAAKGFDHITLTVNHQADLIKAFFGDGSKWNIKVDYSLEDRPLSTMGPLKLIRDLPENFLVMNGDVLTDIDFDWFFNFHVSGKQIYTISAFDRVEISEYGVLNVNEQSILTGFTEKPKNYYTVSMGVYMVNRGVLDFIPANIPYGFDKLMLDLLAASRQVVVHKHNSYWLDIGRPDDYMQAIDEFEHSKEKFLPNE
jgi:NDP-sugar pyrophosphorylase family protein